MGCNAWNHPPSCDCGWGGVNYGGARGAFVRSPVVTSGVWREPPARETRPSTCPHCGADVFFFRDENGGATFFDKLGTPWPKHPCFDVRTFPGRQFRSLSLPMEKDHCGLPAALHWPQGPCGETELRARVVAVHYGQGQQTLLVETCEPDLSFFVVTEGWRDDASTLGFISTADNPGQMLFRPQGQEIELPHLSFYGPCFSVFDLSSWSSTCIIDEAKYHIAHDISEGRWRRLGGVYFRPEWRFALRTYVDLLSSRIDVGKLVEVATTFSGPAVDLLSQAEKRVLRVCLANLSGCDSDEVGAIYDEILDLLAIH